MIKKVKLKAGKRSTGKTQWSKLLQKRSDALAGTRTKR